MAYFDFTSSSAAPQAPKGGYGFLSAILDSLEDAHLLDTLQSYRRTGRPGYPLRAMWRAYLVKFILKIRFSNELLDRLRSSGKLRSICGFDDVVPSESVLSRLISRLANHTAIVKNLLVCVTNKLRDLLPASQPLGQVVAIDSTLFPSYSNPNRKHIKDPDARWGVKHSARAKEGGTEWGWGYKMHLLSDANHGLPLDFIVTPANQSDSTMLPTVVSEARTVLPWLRPRYLLADRGYDSEANHKALVRQRIIPIIHIRKPTRTELHHGIYTTLGEPTCIGKVGMDYQGTDPKTGSHLFRCPPDGCHLKDSKAGATRHCDSTVWENPAKNLRIVGIVPRASRLWKKLYAKRMSIERVFRSLKHSRGLEGHCMRGMRKILLQATMSVLTFQGTALARLRTGEPSEVRRMAVKVG